MVQPQLDYPKLRPLDIRRHFQDGRSYLMLRDPLQLSDGTLLVPQLLSAVLTMCDGTRAIAEMARICSTQYRLTIAQDTITELIAALNQAYLLENDRTQAFLAAVKDEYRAAPFRAALFAGHGYPSAKGDLGAMLDTLLADTPTGTASSNMTIDCHGILSPHIDYSRGGQVYAQVWKQAADAVRAAEYVIMFGTDHYGDDPFTLTRQNYATPYGVLPTAQSVVDEVAGALGDEAAFAGELRHRDEHSLELVSVWLHHMRGGIPVDVMPILTGSFDRSVGNGAGPGRDMAVESVLNALVRATAGKRVLVLASGDLAHVGPAFGGKPLSAPDRQRLRQADDRLVQAMRLGDYTAFYSEIKRLRNTNNVCGVSPIYLTMRMIELLRGSLSGRQFGYAICPADESDTSVVSICGMTFGE